jgi:hypothetical protein
MDQKAKGLINKLHDLEIKYFNLCNDDNPSETSDGQLLQNKIKDAGLECLAYHGCHNNILCWMIDFIGISDKTTSISNDDVHNLIESGNIPVGSLFYSVKDWISKWIINKNAFLTDVGFGGGKWHLGVHCGLIESWQITDNGREHFKNAIKSNILMINPKTWLIKTNIK